MSNTRFSGGLERYPAGMRIGTFRVIRELGQGAQGTVLEAKNEESQATVALKLFERSAARSDEDYERIRKEAQAAQRIRHPGVVRVLHVGEEDGHLFLVQELVEGERLDKRLAAWRALTDRSPIFYNHVSRIAAGIAVGLAAAHKHGVLHRDVKPQNILLAEDDQPKVLDFGLARIDDAESVSSGGALVGTPAYMSPDQIRLRSHELDARTDVFGLGVTLYEMLTGELPFHGSTAHQTLEQVLIHQPPSPDRMMPGVPRELSLICMKALEKRRADRYQSMDELHADLQRFLDGYPVHARIPSLPRRVQAWCKRHPTAAAVIVVSVLGAFSTVLFAISAEQERRESVRRSQEIEDTFRFLEEMFQYLDPRDEGTAALVERAASLASLSGEWSTSVRVRGLVLLGGFFSKWGQYERAARAYEDAVDLCAQGREFNEQCQLTEIGLINAKRELAVRSEVRAHELEQLKLRAEELVERLRQMSNPDAGRVSEAFVALGQVCRDAGMANDAEAALMGGLDGFRKSPEHGPDSWQATTAENILGRFYLQTGRLEEAEALISHAVEVALSMRESGSKDYATNFRIQALGRLRRAQDRLSEAEVLYRECAEALHKVLGETHPESITATRNLALLIGRIAQRMEQPERYPESLALLNQALDASRRRGGDYVEEVRALFSVANMQRKAQYIDEAIASFEELLGLASAHADEYHAMQAHYGLGRCFQVTGKIEDAARHAKQALQLVRVIEVTDKEVQNCESLAEDVGILAH